GRVAREAALARYSLGRFLRDMDAVLHDAVDATAGRRARRAPAASTPTHSPNHPLDERTTR
ncbi:glycosyltransferase family 1 protein, partial [Clavibacter michiganensis subsp. michiganensis]|nr:glycosyltransferase family 1 protein [Clavibacter michiganensis subsp. michiganensis]